MRPALSCLGLVVAGGGGADLEIRGRSGECRDYGERKVGRNEEGMRRGVACHFSDA